MQVDPEDKADSGPPVPEQRCKPCEFRLDLEHDIKMSMARQHLLGGVTRVMTEHHRFNAKTDGDYQEKLGEIQALEEHIEWQRGKLKNAPICDNDNCIGRSRRINEEMRKLKIKSRESRESDFVSPNKRKTAQQSKAVASPNNCIVTKNSFQPLVDLTESNEQNTETSAVPEQVPPIMIRYTKDGTSKILADIRKVCGPTENKFTNGLVKIFPGTSQKHTEISNYCRTQGYDFHVIQPASKRPFKVVLKNLPHDHDIEEIKHCLKNELNFPVEKVVQLTKFRTREPLPFFLVELTKTKDVEKIYQIRHVNNFKVKVEEYKGRGIVNQCYKCNWYHHKAGECQSRARCLKCAGPHETNQCSIKETIPNPICINCGEEGHVASYRGCKKFPKKTTAQQNRENYFYSNRSTFNPETNRIRENISYARASNPQPHREMAPHTQVNPTTNSNTLPNSTPGSDFKDMIEGLAELKKFLQEFPNLLTALKKLKHAQT
ncbi:Nucleic-acid-binding protein from transposon X-element, partial [Araneus ventricosus]